MTREVSAAAIRAIIRRRIGALASQLQDMRDDLTITENANTPRAVDELGDVIDGVAEEVKAIAERVAELRAAVEAGR